MAARMSMQPGPGLVRAICTCNSQLFLCLAITEMVVRMSISFKKHLLNSNQGSINSCRRNTLERKECFPKRQRVAKRPQVFHTEEQQGGVSLVLLGHHQVESLPEDREQSPSVSGSSRLGKVSAVIVARHNLVECYYCKMENVQKKQP